MGNIRVDIYVHTHTHILAYTFRQYKLLYNVNWFLVLWLSSKIIHLPMQEEQELPIWSLGQKDPLEKEMATHSSILAWSIPWTEEPDRLQSMGLKRVGHDWVAGHTHTHTHTHTHIHTHTHTHRTTHTYACSHFSVLYPLYLFICSGLNSSI